ncbi:cation transporter [Corynebacterium sp.]|uniref:cation transporter n=1 Tax=Corynebacterium sp. TaxID=1720 RepID=UPI0026DB06C9|nr:heavy metal-associated domain-containing protein [Corynebacterium sp.]MDO5032440.1 heavy metal-associated domain-containing protein [Corynebacterium sp.]
MSATTIKKIVLRSDEFSCPSCVAKIEAKLTAMPGVDSAEVKFSSGRIVIEYDPETVSVKQLVAAVKDVGYTATPSMY